MEKPETAYGVFIDAPMNVSHEGCRYYAGLPSQKINSEKNNMLEIDEGSYAYFDVSGNFDVLEQKNKKVLREIH